MYQMLVKLLLGDAPNRLPAHKTAIFQHLLTVVFTTCHPFQRISLLSHTIQRATVLDWSRGSSALFFQDVGWPAAVSLLFLDRSCRLCTLGCLFPISHNDKPRNPFDTYIHVRCYGCAPGQSYPPYATSLRDLVRTTYEYCKFVPEL